MKACIIGGTGFIGSRLVSSLLSQGDRVTSYSRHAREEISHPMLTHVAADISDRNQLVKAIYGSDIVIHAANTTVPSTAAVDPAEDVSTNLLPLLGLFDLMEQLSIRKFVYFSSGGTVYGDPNIIPTPESHPLNPDSAYGIAKCAAEHYIRHLSNRNGIESLVLRVSNPYGPGQSTLGAQGVIGSFLGKVIASEPLNIWGDGKNKRDFVYIDDVISAVVELLKTNSSGVFNVGGGASVEINSLIEMIEKCAGRSLKVRYLPSRCGGVRESHLDISKIYTECGWMPKTKLLDGIRVQFEHLKGTQS